MIPVKSSLIKQVKYMAELASLKVEFKDGSKYLYKQVTKKDYEAFMTADSKGKFFNQHFKGKGKKVFS